jgi:ATP-dependent RNA helicase DDX54/DBP10
LNQVGLAARRFKHTKTKAPKAPDRFRDDYHLQKKRAAEATKEGSQLRTVDQIRKLRLQKEQKKKKNARPSRRKR